MSSRAVRVPAARVAAFQWASVGEPASFEDTYEAAPAQPVAPPPSRPEPSAADLQAKLAALERDAFTKGYAQGERAGVEAAELRADGVLRKLGDTLEELAGLRRHLLQQSERQLVQLALALARRIVNREVMVDEELAGALARIALERLGEAGPATVHLNPDDFAKAAARHAERWKLAHVTVIADPTVARGGCLVESPFGFVDASIDAQFEELAHALLDDTGVMVNA